MAKHLAIIAKLHKADQKRKRAEAMQKLQLDASVASASLNLASTLANALFNIAGKGGKKLFYLNKSFALAEAGVAMWLAVAKANALGPPLSIPAGNSG